MSIQHQNEINELRARVEALEHVANEQQRVIESLLDKPVKSTERKTPKLRSNVEAN